MGNDKKKEQGGYDDMISKKPRNRLWLSEVSTENLFGKRPWNDKSLKRLPMVEFLGRDEHSGTFISRYAPQIDDRRPILILSAGEVSAEGRYGRAVSGKEGKQISAVQLQNRRGILIPQKPTGNPYYTGVEDELLMTEYFWKRQLLRFTTVRQRPLDLSRGIAAEINFKRYDFSFESIHMAFEDDSDSTLEEIADAIMLAKKSLPFEFAFQAAKAFVKAQGDWFPYDILGYEDEGAFEEVA